MSRYFCLNPSKTKGGGFICKSERKVDGFCLLINKGQGCKWLKINPKVLKNRRRRHGKGE